MIRKRISLTAAVLVALTVALACVALLAVSSINNATRAVTENSLPAVYRLGKLAQLNRSVTGNMLLHIGVASKQAEMDKKIAVTERNFEELLQEYQASLSTQAEREKFDQIPITYAQLKSAWAKIRVLSAAGDQAGAWNVWLSDGRPALLAVEKALNEEIQVAKTTGEQNAKTVESAVSRTRVLIWTLLVISGMAGAGLSYFLVRWVNAILRSTSENLQTGAEQMFSAAGQVASSSNALARDAIQMSEFLQSTSESAEKISVRLEEGTANTQKAVETMRAVADGVKLGNTRLGETVASMEAIRNSSAKILQINKVIDDIAFQTNILALNAAVEAARAGDAGLGFAVVADEVRNLAQRCAQAARDTSNLIEESVTKSQEGGGRVQHVSAAMRDITVHVENAKALMDLLSSSTVEQERGVAVITQSVGKIERVSQTTAAGAEEGAAASEELSAQARVLNDVVRELTALVG
jgi:methyl-accepting chemotaxis protein